MLYELVEARFPKNLFREVENYLHDRKIRIVKKSTVEKSYAEDVCKSQTPDHYSGV